ncbi:TetR/AcrR family transcriptional regulator [Nocardioides sp.]|jgi:AcrR family transcriptional regulator|uniref:TetR/AcrR family transcriptional regulator n=1 Tax=Nocardioides sp. TaxID=35761 RepID=UPI002CF40717|nr:TetR/AcrR family transcriptional regulator [Nocardioides sp.]HVX55865.1 TetR/AcrR family transcriptional regulator [Nocardioides sp.]
MAEKSWQAGPLRVRVMTRDEPPRERLTRDRIVDVALDQMAEQGYDAVSMRTVARALGTGPASLYAHVANKDELDQLVIDRIASLVELPEPDADTWRDQVRQLIRDMLAAYRAHPGSARAALATIPTGEGGLRVAEAMMAVLITGGVPPQAAAWFCDLAALYVSAIAAEESIWVERAKAAAAAGEPIDEQAMVERVRRVFASLPASAYPMLAGHAEAMTSGDGEERFEFGLDVLLAGLEAVAARMH